MLLLSQGKVSFVAEVEEKQIDLNSEFELRFTLENVEGHSFKGPTFPGFTIVSGPEKDAGSQINKGIVTIETTYSYELRPTKIGKFTIESASIISNGKRLKTKPLYLEVVEGKERDIVFLKAIPDSSDAIIGQQFQIRYKFYHSVHATPYAILEESDYPGFFAQHLKDFNNTRRIETINGKEYNSYVVKMVSLFPQQAGKVIIDPLKLRVTIEVDPNSTNAFFLRKNPKTVIISSEPLELNISSLPDEAPKSFTGAVGKYDFQVSFEKYLISTDEALQIKLLMSGDGDPKRLIAPELALPKDSFEIFPAAVLDDRTFEKDGHIQSKVLIEYQVIPKFPGTYFLQPEFSYFDTDSLKYVNLKSPLTRIHVTKGNNEAATATKGAKKFEAQEDIRFIAMETKLKQKNFVFFDSPLFWVLSLLPFVLIAGLYSYKQILNKRANIDSSVLKRNKANHLALTRLHTAKTYLEHQKSRDFYDEVSRAALGYVCDKLQIPLSELSKENVQEKLEHLSVDQSHITSYMKILETCEMALFAGKDNAEAMTAIYEQCLEVIGGMEEDLK